MKSLVLSASFLIFALATPVFADGEKPPIGMIVHGGKTALHGDLGDKALASTLGFSVLIWGKERDRDSLGGLSSFIMVDFTDVDSTAKTATKFPFTAGKSLHLSEVGILPVVCAMASLPVQACLGVGYVIVKVADSDNEQNYGAFRYDLRVGHYVGRGFIGGIEAKFLSVEQKVSGVSSSFADIAYQAGLGYAW
jgi:hypothetical protein